MGALDTLGGSMVGVTETEMVVVEGRERQTETPVDRVIRLGLPPGHNHIRCTSLQLQTLNYLSPPTDNDSHPYIPVNKLVPICFLMGNLYIYD